jgi:hypothetical protein
MMLAHGFTVEQIVGIVCAVLTSAHAERVVAGRQSKSRG